LFGKVAHNFCHAPPQASRIRTCSRVVGVDNFGADHPEFPVATYVVGGGNDGATTTATTRALRARTVLVTVPLGVLKAGTINFVPPLLEEKLAAIKAMGYGTMNKCILSWYNGSAPVWPEEDTWFMLIVLEEETSGTWTSFFNPLLLMGRPTLVLFAAKDDATAMEDQLDKDVLEGMMANLRAMFPDVPDLDVAHIMQWGKVEDFLSAHSYPILGRDIAEDMGILSEAYGRLYFVGEATAGGNWGRTMGAWNTGEEQALTMA
jgi:polyamine oxidase